MRFLGGKTSLLIYLCVAMVDPWWPLKEAFNGRHPLRKLSTIHLIDFYRRINQKYYQDREKRRRQVGSGGRQRHHQVWQQHHQGQQRTHSASAGTSPSQASSHGGPPRDIVHDRYVVGRLIGKGSFGQVVVAYDVLTDTSVVSILRGHFPPW